ncbi:hypothetical protein GCM10007108_02160 [Thermogymnomonas acidicola]|uniref:Uncharacterized protein n=1 Tax=Thermogymnomonas acidicola TaxID=399579 RepID=A0AA37BPY3_9ARCH|nr:hypothetical protein [Thermogymnomonas acidicola]GGM67691.1 hypothetical protein GCM10007108_02160 [Thermogymnomonas acidicola]
MHSSLRIRRLRDLDQEYLDSLLRSCVEEGGSCHLLLSDGVVLDVERYLGTDMSEMVMVQRILTPFQLRRILLEGDTLPHLIVLSSSVLSEWGMEITLSVLDIMRMKAYFQGCQITLVVFGAPFILDHVARGLAVNG